MFLQYSSSGRPPIVVHFVDSITFKDSVMRVTHSDDLIETEKTLDDGAVIIIDSEDNSFSVKVVKKDGSVYDGGSNNDRVVLRYSEKTFTMCSNKYIEDEIYSIYFD